MAEVLTPKPATESRTEAVAVETWVAVPTPEDPSLSRARRRVLFAAPVALLVLGWGVGTALYVALRAGRSESPAVAAHPDGARLFAQHCANCHGERGDGNGIAHLDPRARYFGGEKFKLVTTTNRTPSDDDLLRVLRHGIPGSAMPAFNSLSEAEHRALIRHVRSLARTGQFAQEYKVRKKRLEDELGGDLTREELNQLAAEAAKVVEQTSQPGPPLEVPAAFPPPTPESLARGRAVYLQTCASCHGPEGRGDGAQVKDPKFRNENGTPARPRDLTAGVFKGGGEPQDLYARIRLGIPGTPMPATPAAVVPERDVLDLINYVRSLSQQPGPAAGTSVAGR